jgi:hypothetical protein
MAVDNSSRLLRAVVTVLTLLGCLWALNQFKSRPRVQQASPPEERSITEAPQTKPAAFTVLPPVEIQSLPLVALDNTCEWSDTMDLSACTRALSGSAVRVYQIDVSANQPLFIRVEPLSDYFDAGVTVLSADRVCAAGADEHGAGLKESLVLKNLPAGSYRVIVSGYSDDCGPYELTIRAERPPIAEVRPPTTRTGPNGTVISWQTFAEVDLAHFVVFRIDGASRQQIGSLRSHGGPASLSTYRLVDRQPIPDASYELQVVAHDGRSYFM